MYEFMQKSLFIMNNHLLKKLSWWGLNFFFAIVNGGLGFTRIVFEI